MLTRPTFFHAKDAFDVFIYFHLLDLFCPCVSTHPLFRKSSTDMRPPLLPIFRMTEQPDCWVTFSVKLSRFDRQKILIVISRHLAVLLGSSAPRRCISLRSFPGVPPEDFYKL